ncbi:hypothetical protein WN51_13078 [Melipona quadrifasciata]|uniref:Uncharacterized protein n=1 Tax=Melipona quadrifasciata TaxID=166423 RepID=A0A0N0U5A2_9HYME|nr:hypothetical protein WN51_13078 [Melipona quadrifasciata]
MIYYDLDDIVIKKNGNITFLVIDMSQSEQKNLVETIQFTQIRLYYWVHFGYS